MKTKLMIEQHIHGAFGIDFNKASVDEVLEFSRKILTYGVGGVFPTLVTDSVENVKRAISVIKEAASFQTSDMAEILGIHIEGIFINPLKKGIHNEMHFMSPTIENYQLIEDDFIKIVTLAPELIDVENDLIDYLKSKGVKVQAGHCVSSDLKKCDGVTHLFNAMGGINHRENSTALEALVNNDLYVEVIADGVHLSDEILELVLRCKPMEKIILVSDSLPIAKSDKSQMVFADEEIFYNGEVATSKAGTIAGSTALLSDVIKRIKKFDLIENPYRYHNIDIKGFVEWDEDFNIVRVCKDEK